MSSAAILLAMKNPLITYRSYVWKNNSCYIDVSLESINAAVLHILGSNGHAHEIELVTQLTDDNILVQVMNHIQTRFRMVENREPARGLIAALSNVQNLVLQYAANRGIIAAAGSFGSPIDLITAIFEEYSCNALFDPAKRNFFGISMLGEARRGLVPTMILPLPAHHSFENQLSSGPSRILLT